MMGRQDRDQGQLFYIGRNCAQFLTTVIVSDAKFGHEEAAIAERSQGRCSGADGRTWASEVPFLDRLSWRPLID
jgi:hypothetical protein